MSRIADSTDTRTLADVYAAAIEDGTLSTLDELAAEYDTLSRLRRESPDRATMKPYAEARVVVHRAIANRGGFGIKRGPLDAI